MSVKKKKKKAAGAMPANAREQINVLALIKALEQHVLGKKKMKSTQVSAALALLKKTLPDLTEPARRLLQETPQSHEEALKELE